MEERFAELKERLAVVHDLRRAIEMLFWDQTVMMPPGGAAVRAAQLTTLFTLAHAKFIADEIGELLDELEPWQAQLDYDSDESSMLRRARRDWTKQRRVPSELAGELTRAAAEGHEIWAKARQDVGLLAVPPPPRALGRAEEPVHRLLRRVRRALRRPTRRLRAGHEDGGGAGVFDELKEELVPLIAEVGSIDGDDAFMSGPWPLDAQHEYSLKIIERFGYDPSFARLDRTVHPFAASSGTQDIRLTTRYAEDDIKSIFTAMHECGHGLYEHGVSPSLERTILCHGASYALHESQSRLWENLVGRSREFWNHFYPSFQATFPEAVGDVDQERFYRAINRVKPSFIRVDADEATYNLHIILRFELEQEILAGTIALKDLPEAWNARFEEYFGLEVPDDRLGVLQDVHWSGGGFGYFPTYSLGNIMSVQIWEKVLSEIPDLPEQFEQGEFGQLHEWLQSRLYSLGRKYTPQETLERVVGGPIDAGPYIRYLKEKLGTLAAA